MDEQYHLKPLMEQVLTHGAVRAPPGDISAGGGTSMYNPTESASGTGAGHAG